MKKLMFISGITLLFLCLSSVRADDDELIKIQFQIFRFSGELQGKAWADEDDIWTTDEPPEKLKHIVKVFNKAQFEIADGIFDLNDDGCFWKHAKIPITSEEVNLPAQLQLIASQSIQIEDDSQMDLKIRSDLPVQYLVRREDGLFELKEKKLSTGIDMEIEVDAKHDHIYFEDLVIKVRTLDRRKKIPGVNLDIGEPILEIKDYETYFRLEPDRDYGLTIKREYGSGGLFIRFKTSLEDESDDDDD